VRDAEIDKMLDDAAHRPHQVPAALLERIADSLEPSQRPVRPLAAPWILTVALVLVCAAVALLGAARLGLQGVAALSTAQRLLILGTLALLAWFVAAQAVREWIPGSRGRMSGVAMLASVSLALLAVFALLFRDYRTTHFVSAGLACLFSGLMHAIPAGLLVWWLLRRGYVVNGVAAGLAAGTLAGLAGLTMLELHCPNFETLHVLVWHTLVVPASAALGAIVGWVVQTVTDRN
jgi:hypothetical protein